MLSTYLVPYKITSHTVKRPLGLKVQGYLTFETFSELHALMLAKETLKEYNHVIFNDRIVVY